MTFKKTILTTTTLFIDVVSWFLGGMVVNDVTKFVTMTTMTKAAIFDMGVTLFLVAVFFVMKLATDNALTAVTATKKTKKKSKKKKAKKKFKVSLTFKANGRKAVKAFKKAHRNNNLTFK